MSDAQRGVPPSIDGYTYVSWLGGGGFADVYLYDQHLPARRVAVKVLRDSVDDDDSRRLFAAEANLMARVSTHPNIVTIHTAGVSADRRPFLVMEYYPLPHFGERVKSGRVPFQQVLEVGIKIASAVETAHQAKIVHRDIKPANVLSSDFGEPGLTDFGISAARTDALTDESLGFSPPYAPPEILADEHPGDELSDVYSLSATLWAMLAGHSPFERPGDRNTRADVIRRGLNEPVPPLPGGSAPPALEHALRAALSKDRAARPQSARSFAMMLQAVEEELGYRPTQLVLVHDRAGLDSAVAEVAEAADKTKVGKGVVVNPDVDRARVSMLRDGLIEAVPSDGAGYQPTGARPSIAPLPRPFEPADPDTVKSTRAEVEAAAAAEFAVPTAPARRFPAWAWAAAGAVVVGLIAVIGVVASSGGGAPSATTLADGDQQVDAPVTFAPASDLASARSGSEVTFSWRHPDSSATFEVTPYGDFEATPAPSTTGDTSITLTDIDLAQRVCVRVVAIGADGSRSEEAKYCDGE